MAAANDTLRTICIVTGTRADYGLLQPLMGQVAGDADLRLQIIATGTHLAPEFGETYRAIEADGFRIDAKVDMELSSDSPEGVARSMGLGLMGIAEALARLKPDIVVVLGDRFEALAAACAAVLARIPVAHLHGGEVSEGAVDESLRHAITKLARWHFVAAEPYRKRVVQLGEAPDQVFNTGAPGLDHLKRLEWLSREALETALSMKLKAPVILVTYHPATLGSTEPVTALNELLAALETFPEATVVVTGSNADAGGRALIARMEEWVDEHSSRARSFVSLGTQRYLSLMRLSHVVVGNSSSALIEAPALGRATVNIGDRQRGRLKASSIIDAPEERGAIADAISRAMSPEFQATLPATVSLYGAGDAGRSIKETLKKVTLDARKPFFDIAHGH